MCPTIQFRLRGGDERIFAGCAASSPICFFFALLTLARFSINIGFVERPLAVGFIWSLWTGDLSTGLALGVFFELFGLDYLAAGSYLPPNPLFPLLVSLLWVGQTAINEPSYVAAFAVWSCPLAYLGAYMEQQQRRWQSRGYTELLEARHSVAGLEKVAERRILLAMGQLFAASFALFIVGGSFWYAVYAALVKGIGRLPGLPDPPWLMLACLSSVGAFLALRTRRSFITFGVLSTGIAVYCFLGLTPIL